MTPLYLFFQGTPDIGDENLIIFSGSDWSRSEMSADKNGAVVKKTRNEPNLAVVTFETLSGLSAADGDDLLT